MDKLLIISEFDILAIFCYHIIDLNFKLVLCQSLINRKRKRELAPMDFLNECLRKGGKELLTDADKREEKN